MQKYTKAQKLSGKTVGQEQNSYAYRHINPSPQAHQHTLKHTTETAGSSKTQLYRF